eukprot:CAMPEP_0119475842 /NCGR_PEP_ID=MMETSP1344-20130328/6585_1 /TAXON_ID=236787 /ORGANISM="Florenciella parvula, Strain CCMP2471" /LENGTH=50 /DNA_ID=CAMNT_0007509467 /DNA_START=118 /DNA_END=266 /DNA_ORIENTATION=-
MVYLRETAVTTTQRSTNATAGTNLPVMRLNRCAPLCASGAAEGPAPTVEL